MTALSGVVGGAARVISPQPVRGRVENLPRSQGMEGVRELLSAARDGGLAAGNFRGLLHIAIGRRVTRGEGRLVSAGVTWRELAAELKHLRFDTDLVREFGADPQALAARDRERYWYSAIAAARVDSPEASAEADRLGPRLAVLGFTVGPPPGGPAAAPGREKPAARAKEKPAKPAKKKKK